jgi:murein DD-endopeptidase MepM/ murein hydrolase activator NlpD
VLTPGANLQTRDSVALLVRPPDVSSVRVAGAISPASSFSAGVAAAAASSGEAGAGVRPLADIIDPTKPFLIYVTQPGDSASAIAAKHGISLSTFLDNNPTADDVLLVGQEVIVPRRDGILYKVAYGDTVDSIVGQYDNVTSAAVIDYRPNNLASGNGIAAGDYLLLPGATRKPPPPPPPQPAPAPRPTTGGGSSGGGSSTTPPPSGGIFGYPLAAWRAVSDPFGTGRGGGSIHEGIDLDLYGMSGSPIFAACSGVVTRTEYLTYSYGYHIVIDCGGGFTTLYAHLGAIHVSPGQRVGLGSQIGISGLTGYTTGEHLHFEIRLNGAPLNPAYYLGF